MKNMSGLYCWVILNLYQIITKLGDKYKIIEVFPGGTLFGYPENEKIIPEPKNNMKYDENKIYETYS